MYRLPEDALGAIHFRAIERIYGDSVRAVGCKQLRVVWGGASSCAWYGGGVQAAALCWGAKRCWAVAWALGVGCVLQPCPCAGRVLTASSSCRRRVQHLASTGATACKAQPDAADLRGRACTLVVSWAYLPRPSSSPVC